MKLPSSLTTISPFLKIVALAVVVALPFMFFYFGYKYSEGKRTTADENSTSSVVESENESESSANSSTNTIEQSAPMYTIVDTGQDKCSNDQNQINCPAEAQDYFGQDAQYTGNATSYRDNGDGTVTDLVTGLMWQKDPGDKVEYDAAVTGAATLNLAGHTDWRLPTIKELYSLIDFRGTDPSETSRIEALVPFIDDDYFEFKYGDVQSGDRLIDSQWATSTVYTSTVMNGQECFFGVNFADGRIKCYPTSTGKGYFVMYVRGDSYGENSFKDNSDGTISDEVTGLMWTKSDNGQGVLWKNALAYCENLQTGGHADWRLPNAKELQSIVDYTRSPDATNSPAIDAVFECTQIVNEAGESDYGFYWTSTTHIRDPNYYVSAAYVSFGRAMGYMAEFGGWVDVHGAGAQRSDPKGGVSAGQELGFGPQGDARRGENYVRCVR